MAIQNLISAAITPEVQSSVLSKLNGVKTDLNILISILPQEKREYLSIGNVMLPFLDLAHETAQNHPEILPSVFNMEEYEKDYQLTKSLMPIFSALQELYNSIAATFFAANSDTMVESLDIYAFTKQNENRVPGLATPADRMRAFFKKSSKSSNAPANPA